MVNSSNEASAITLTCATSGEWGVGTGEDDPTERMLNGMGTSFATTEAAAQTITFNGVPAGNHSVLVYIVQVPLEFFNMDFSRGYSRRPAVRMLSSSATFVRRMRTNTILHPDSSS